MSVGNLAKSGGPEENTVLQKTLQVRQRHLRQGKKLNPQNFKAGTGIEHLGKVHHDIKRHEQIVLPHDIPPIQPPEFNLEAGPSKWKEVESTVRRKISNSPWAKLSIVKALQECTRCSTLSLESNEDSVAERNNT